MKCTTYDEVYLEYQNIARKVLKDRKDLTVLKTDCYNESGISPIPKPLVPILIPHCSYLQIFEIDENIINKALKSDFMHNEKVNIKKQDLIQFDEKERKYDIIFDFSTIDHMPFEDALSVLGKYKKALKQKGELLIVVWLNEEKHWNVDQQYYFKTKDFDEALRNLFTISNNEYLFSDHNSDLWCYWMKKKEKGFNYYFNLLLNRINEGFPMKVPDKFNFLKLLRKYFDFMHLFIQKLGGFDIFINKVIEIFKTKGIKGVIKKTKYILSQAKSGKLAFTDDINYTDWLKTYHRTSQKDILIMQNSIDSFVSTPLVSVIMPTYNSNVKWLKEAIESLQNQTYTNWELCIADDASTNNSCINFLLE